MENFYHIRYNPDLDEEFCAMRRTPCACTGCVGQPSNTWLPNLNRTLKPHHDIKPETCKYSSILSGYNKWYICQIDLKKKQQTHMIRILKTSLSWTAWLGKQKTRFNKITLVHLKLATVTRLDIIFFDGQVMHITCRKSIHVMHFILQL